ncbi:AraC family transcriptional regulator [Aquimarina sp. D1M17]|uniref:helix-turn-helix transcriptional regulator n=1 Tax=Aquimarina acroporae TaxID=2937283 RepID=UPI0020BE649F|nr:AraC family transcriptional regulator [Aquimarina acroporae]MCK8520484.1 AraC family transcriptional regulator [Aquimarina acroporae]
MSFNIPNPFQPEQTDAILKFDNQNFIQFHKKEECSKRPIELEQHVITIILKGKKVLISTEQEITAEKNELLFVQKGTYLTSEKILEDGAFSSLLFFIHEDFLNSFKKKYHNYLTKVINTPVSKIFKAERSENLDIYIKSLLPYFDHPQKTARPLLQIKLEELLLSLLLSDTKNQLQNYLLSLDKVVNTSFKESIENSIFKNLTIEERAFLSNQSVSSFKRKFKEVFQDSPAHWLREQRLKRAKVLINATDKSIADISYEVGFESPSHFIHIFKKKYGVTPKKLLTK